MTNEYGDPRLIMSYNLLTLCLSAISPQSKLHWCHNAHMGTRVWWWKIAYSQPGLFDYLKLD